MRLEEEFGAGVSKVGAKTPSPSPAPLSHISGVKKPLGLTNSWSGATLPKFGVELRIEHEPELEKVEL